MINWKANYNDGSFLKQYNAKGEPSKYTDIDRSMLTSFELRDESRIILKMNLSSEQKLIYRRRVQKNFFTGVDVPTYLVGWQQNVGGVNIQHIHLIYSDGSVETINKWGERLYCSPNFLECEK